MKITVKVQINVNESKMEDGTEESPQQYKNK